MTQATLTASLANLLNHHGLPALLDALCTEARTRSDRALAHPEPDEMEHARGTCWDLRCKVLTAATSLIPADFATSLPVLK